MNSSPVRCDAVPIPCDPKLNLPALALATATNSCTDLAGKPGRTTSTLGIRDISATGSKPAGSKLSFL
jgi:hypothetical protein